MKQLLLGLLLLTACNDPSPKSPFIPTTTSTTVTPGPTTTTVFEDTSTSPHPGKPSDYPTKQGECLTDCLTQLMKAQDGAPIDWSFTSSCWGPTDLSRWNTFGGSQNQPVVCNAAKYLESGDPKWFTEWTTLQKTTMGLLGTEMMSPLYGPPVVMSMVSVLGKAQRSGHTELATLVASWLRAYWALNSLAAIPSPMTKMNLRVLGKDAITAPANSQYFNGLTVAMGGSRVNFGFTADSMVHTYLSAALNWQPFKYTRKLTPFSKDGFLLFYNAARNQPLKPIPATKVGLTESERNQLVAFIKGQGSLESVEAMVKPYFLVQPITFYRTDQGVAMYYGLGTVKHGHNANGNKCPFFSVSATNDGFATYLYPYSFQKLGCPAGDSWSDGKQICVTGQKLTDCVSLPSGNVKYQLGLDTDGTFTRFN